MANSATYDTVIAKNKDSSMGVSRMMIHLIHYQER